MTQYHIVIGKLSNLQLNNKICDENVTDLTLRLSSNMTDPSRHLPAQGVVLVSLLLTLNIFHTLF